MMGAIRRISAGDRKVLYLTFDDGPDSASTPAVREVLERHGARATFFVVADRAREEVGLIRELLAAGHSIGNHSLDHGYAKFFGGRSALREWVSRAEAELESLTGAPTVGFRPPAGVRTPELHAALEGLRIPLVLWKTRFYDAVFRWSEARALGALAASRAGDIIVLHDRQPASRLPMFLATLDRFLTAGKSAGYEFESLTREKVERENHV